MWQEENAQLTARVKSIVNKTIKLTTKLSKRSKNVKWTSVCEPTQEFLRNKYAPLTTRKCVAQYLAKNAKFPVKLGEPFDFSDDVVDIAAIEKIAKELDMLEVTCNILLDIYNEQFSGKNKFPLEQIFNDFLKFYDDPKTKPENFILKLTAQPQFHRQLPKKQLFNGIKITTTFVDHLFDNREINSCCIMIGASFWSKIAGKNGIQDLLLPDADIKLEKYIKQVLETAAEKLDSKGDYSKEFKFFVINCLLFNLAGVGALRWTKVDYSEASTTVEFVKRILEKLRLGQQGEGALDAKKKNSRNEEKQTTQDGEEKSKERISASKQEEKTRSAAKRDTAKTTGTAVSFKGDTQGSSVESPSVPAGYSVVTGRLHIVELTSGTFYNFYPIVSWEKDVPSYIKDVKTSYPSLGNFRLGQFWECPPSAKKIFVNGGLYNIIYNHNTELKVVESGNSKTKYELNAPKLFEEGHIYRADRDPVEGRRAFYKVVPTEKENLSDIPERLMVKMAGLDTLPKEIHKREDDEDVLVLLDIGDCCIGPFVLMENKVGKLYIRLKRPESKQKDYVYDGYVPINGEGLPSTGVCWDGGSGLDCAFVGFYKTSTIDLISNEKLLELLVKEMPKNDIYLNIKEWLSENGSNIKSSQLTSERIDRVLKLVGNADSVADQFGKIQALLLQFIKTNLSQKSDLVSATAKVIANDLEATALLHKDKGILRGIHKLDERKKQLEGDIEKLKTTKEDEEKKRQRSSLAVEIKRLESEISAKKDELKELQEREEKFDDAKRQLENFEGRLNQTIERVANVAFDGPITSKIMETASHWTKKDTDGEYERKTSVLHGIHDSYYPKDSKVDEHKLNKDLCNQLAKFRDYPKNEFVNLLVCTAQSFLTVLAGEPGSGKTSLCNQLARVLGLTSIAEKAEIKGAWGEETSFANRYIPISVEKGWTSKRDMIGYFNPLNRTFESNNPHLFECLCQLDYEARKGIYEFPYLLLLDEANLSSMEHYFADFMNICDSRNEFSRISLGGNKSIRIPDTLRFLATINNDHTTEMLSPRLVDRTWIIQLPMEKDYGEDVSMGGGTTAPIDWISFTKAYGPGEDIKEIRDILTEHLKPIAKKLSEIGHPISQRTRNAMCGYVSAAKKYMDPNGYSTHDKQDGQYWAALDYAVLQKLLPVINGSGKAYASKLNEIKTDLESEQLSLVKSATKLGQVIGNGEKLMDYYRFF